MLNRNSPSFCKILWQFIKKNFQHLISKINGWMLFTSAIWREGHHYLIWPKSWKWSWHCLTGKRLSNVGSALTNPSWLRIFTKKVWRHSALFMIIWKSMFWKLTRSPFHLHFAAMWNRQGRSIVFFLKNRRKRLKKQKAQEEEMIELKRRKSLLATTISSLHNDADKFANEAEESDDLNIMKELLTKSNSFRATAKEKEAKFREYVLQLKDLHKRKEL